MLNTSNNIISKIQDGKTVRVFLPLKDSREKYIAHGVYRKSTAQYFNLQFNQGVLPINSIDPNGPCILNIRIDGPSTFFEAEIYKIKDLQHLVMTAIRQISPELMREFFRVKVVSNVVVESFQLQHTGEPANNFILKGETIDISASGILASFSNKPIFKKQVKLKINLPTQSNEIINVIAHPVRTVKISDKQYNIAFHFDDITSVDRDKIIECCLIIQRRSLRLKIKVKDL